VRPLEARRIGGFPRRFPVTRIGEAVRAELLAGWAFSVEAEQIRRGRANFARSRVAGPGAQHARPLVSAMTVLGAALWKRVSF